MELADALEYAANQRVGILITQRQDGRAQSSDVSHGVMDGNIVFSVIASRAKVHNIGRDPRVVYHVSNPEGYSYLSFDGTATASNPPTELTGPDMDILIDAFKAVAKKEHPDWDEFRQAMIDEKRAVITVTPTSVVGMINK